ncbi:MAG: ATP-binding protein [Planctomycetota bacterium]|jgi:serine/threonine-protein kinase RsbW|nr:ATP-binding protein [Planctomycetota bacterium]
MANDVFPVSGQTIVFILAPDAVQREAMSRSLSGTLCAVVPLDSVDAGIELLRRGAVCHVAVFSSVILEESGGRDAFARFLSSCRSQPRIVVFGIDPLSEAGKYYAARGVEDFLPRQIAVMRLARIIRNTTMTIRGSRGLETSLPADGWVEVTSPSRMEQFQRIQGFSDALFEKRLPVSVLEDLKLALEEAGRNAFEWGNKFDPGKRVHISYCLFDDRVVIKIEDEGEGFIPDDLPDPTIDPAESLRRRMQAGKRPGGYGVFLIRKLMDDIEYNEKGNVVIMTKRLEPAGEE